MHNIIIRYIMHKHVYKATLATPPLLYYSLVIEEQTGEVKMVATHLVQMGYPCCWVVK